MEELNPEQNQTQEPTSQESVDPSYDNQVADAQPKKKEEDSIGAKNFRELRTQAAQFKKERDELMVYLKQQQAPKSEPETEEEIRLNPDDLVEGKHLSSYDKKIKKLEQQLKSYESKSNEVAIESRIKSNYPDFDRVVNDTTVGVLRDQYPELFNTISTSSDLYSKAVTAYTLVKRLGLVADQETQQEKDQAERNMGKPRSLQSISKSQDSPLARAHAFENGLTDDLKKTLWKEMNDLRKAF